MRSTCYAASQRLLYSYLRGLLLTSAVLDFIVLPAIVADRLLSVFKSRFELGTRLFLPYVIVSFTLLPCFTRRTHGDTCRAGKQAIPLTKAVDEMRWVYSLGMLLTIAFNCPLQLLLGLQ